MQRRWWRQWRWQLQKRRRQLQKRRWWQPRRPWQTRRRQWPWFWLAARIRLPRLLFLLLRRFLGTNAPFCATPFAPRVTFWVTLLRHSFDAELHFLRFLWGENQHSTIAKKKPSGHAPCLRSTRRAPQKKKKKKPLAKSYTIFHHASMVENRKKHNKIANLINLINRFPTSERTSEWPSAAVCIFGCYRP